MNTQTVTINWNDLVDICSKKLFMRNNWWMQRNLQHPISNETSNIMRNSRDIRRISSEFIFFDFLCSFCAIFCLFIVFVFIIMSVSDVANCHRVSSPRQLQPRYLNLCPIENDSLKMRWRIKANRHPKQVSFFLLFLLF